MYQSGWTENRFLYQSVTQNRFCAQSGRRTDNSTKREGGTSTIICSDVNKTIFTRPMSRLNALTVAKLVVEGFISEYAVVRDPTV